MGSGIAAQFANAGVPVDLLDVAAPLPGRNAAALAAIDRQVRSGGFMHESAAPLVRPGNMEDDLARLAEADWIVEAIVENRDAKRRLYARIEAIRRPGTIVSSNTSTIPRADLVAGAGRDFARSFIITHFFNPPRTMRLVEIVGGAEVDPDLAQRARQACETILGKTAIGCRDTPGFIANRLGCHWLAVAVIEATRLGLSPEAADAVNTALGVPRTGAFGLLDLIGIDLVPPIWGSLMQALPPADALNGYDLPAERTIRALLEAGHLGRKAGSGFYRQGVAGRREAYDHRTGLYRPAETVEASALPGGGRDIDVLLGDGGALGAYAWTVFSGLLVYAAETGPEIAADIGAIDAAMQLGYGWRRGPFALADEYGLTAIAARLAAEGRPVPKLLGLALDHGGFYGPEREPLATDRSRGARAAKAEPQNLAYFKRKKAAVVSNAGASLWDIGNGIACLEIHSKLNSLTVAVFDAIEDAIRRCGDGFAGLVIGNDDPRAFSAGADLKCMLDLIGHHDMAALSAFIERGQRLFLALKYAPFPVVAAAHGLALGGGCELLLHADAVVAHSELNAGLPETKLGLVPGWGGCAQLLLRAAEGGAGAKGPAAGSAQAFALIAGGVISTSALDAKARGMLRPGDGIVMNRDHLIGAARSLALELANGYKPPKQALLTLAGPSARLGLMQDVRAAHAAGRLTDTDLQVADALAAVLTGGSSADPLAPQGEAEIMRLERAALVGLAACDATRARIAHMLATGKPLRN
jgi:3-hydroxyacyl-CoA dehydrogenase